MFYVIFGTIANLILFRCSNEINTKTNTLLQRFTYSYTQNYILTENMKDFDYKELSIADLSRMKMPYINYNRKIFGSSEKDFIDMLLSDDRHMLNDFLSEFNNFKIKVSIIMNSIKNLLVINATSELKYNEKYTSDNFLGIDIDNEIKNQLNKEFIKLNTIIKLNDEPLINKADIIFFLQTIDKYVFEEIDANFVLNQLRPSQFLLKLFDENNIHLEDIKWFLNKLIDIYQVVNNIFEYFKTVLVDVEDTIITKTEFTSFISMVNVFMKWDIVINKLNIISSIINLNEHKNIPKIIMIYSNNGENLHEELIKLIEAIVSKKSEEELREMDIIKSIVSNDLFFTPEFDAYEATILGKKYLIKKFDYHAIMGFPSGLSTSYLNMRSDFASIGYMIESFKNETIRSFQSVEEITDLYFTTDNFEAFKFHEDQILYFIVVFLNVLDTLNIYNIKLMSPKILFAVDTKNEDKWRFRVNATGDFVYVKSGSAYENFNHLINVIDSILLVIRNKKLIKIVKSLERQSQTLKILNNPFYIEVLISPFEKNL